MREGSDRSQCSPRSFPSYSPFLLSFHHLQHRVDYKYFKESPQLTSSPFRCVFLIVLSAYYLVEFILFLTSSPSRSSSSTSSFISSPHLHNILIFLYSCCFVSLLIGWCIHLSNFIPRQISFFFSKRILRSLLHSSSASYASPRTASSVSPDSISYSVSYFLSNLFLLTLSFNSFLVLIFRVIISQRYLKDLYLTVVIASDNNDSISSNSLPFNTFIPSDFVLYLFLLPLFIQSFFKSCTFSFILITWCGSIFTATICFLMILPSHATAATGTVVMTTTVSLLMNGFLLYNHEYNLLQQYLLLFTHDTTVQLDGRQRGEGREEEKERINRMHSLEKQHLEKVIGSIAHDLRTPMQSLQLDLNSLIEIILSPLSAPPPPAAATPAAGSGSFGSGGDPFPSITSSSSLTSPTPYALAPALAPPPPQVKYHLPDVQEMVRIIEDLHDTLHFMFASVNRGVDYCKIDSGTTLIQTRELVDYHLCVTNAIGLIARSLVATNGIKIHYHHEILNYSSSSPLAAAAVTASGAPPGVPPLAVTGAAVSSSRHLNKFINTDKTWLFESLLCLISNAVKYSSSGNDVSVYVEHRYQRHQQQQHPQQQQQGHEETSHPCHVCFIVENHSSESILTELDLTHPSLIFHDFSIANRTHGGAGLGLYILATRIKILGGEYGCEIKAKKGRDEREREEERYDEKEKEMKSNSGKQFVTRFWFSLPLHSFPTGGSGKGGHPHLPQEHSRPKEPNDDDDDDPEMRSQSEQSFQKKFDLFENQRLQNFLISSRLNQQGPGPGQGQGYGQGYQQHTSRRGSDEDSNSLLSIRTLDFSRIDHVATFGGSETSGRRNSVASASAPVTVYEEEDDAEEDDDHHPLVRDDVMEERKQKQSIVPPIAASAAAASSQVQELFEGEEKKQKSSVDMSAELTLIDIEQQTPVEVTTESPHNDRRKSDSKGYNKPRFWKMNRKVHSASDLNAPLSSPSSPSHPTTAGGGEEEAGGGGEGDSQNESEVKYARNRGSESKILKTALSLGSAPSREISRREDVKEDKPLSALRISLSSADGNCPSPSSSSRLLTPNTMTTLIPHQHSIISHEEDDGFPSPISAHLPRTILIVDDSTVIQKATKRSLVRAGYEVEVADNGLNGLNLMKEKVYTAVLMDIEMPVMGGLEATKKIREYEEEYFWNRPSNRPRQKIIGVTASTDSSIREKALAVGMDEFLHKPFQLESIQMLFSRLSV